MALLWRNEGNGKLYYRVWRSTGCSTHVLNSNGEAYLRTQGLQAGDHVPDDLLRELESYSDRLPVAGTAPSQQTQPKRRRRRRLIAPQNSNPFVMALVKFRVQLALAFGATAR